MSYPNDSFQAYLRGCLDNFIVSQRDGNNVRVGETVVDKSIQNNFDNTQSRRQQFT